MRKKIALIGAGNIGGTLALLIAAKELGDVVLLDVAEGLAKGKALDLTHAAPLLNSSAAFSGSSSFSEMSGADVCIVTAGLARKPGMSRDDLLQANAAIMTSVAQAIRRHAPSSFVVVISNPLDAMVTLCQRISGLPTNRVVGMAGVLDSARYRAFLAQELGLSSASIQAFVLGGHGDDMVPVRSATTVNGIPIARFVPPQRLEEIENRVRNAGAEVVALLQTGSAFYSPAAAAVEMAESYLKDQKKLLPCAAFLRGEYGFQNLYVGVPCIIGARGVEKVIELDLTEAEWQAFALSVSRVRDLAAKLPQVDTAAEKNIEQEAANF